MTTLVTQLFKLARLTPPQMHITNKTKNRFFNKVVKTEKCWLWIGGKSGSGYGCVRVNTEHWLAHRFSWLIHTGKHPEDLLVCHHCDNPLCVNPEHLFLGTQSDNMKDMWTKGRAGKSEEDLLRFSKVGAKAVRKLTFAEAEALRKDRDNGKTYKELSRHYGISVGSIARILKRETYKSP